MKNGARIIVWFVFLIGGGILGVISDLKFFPKIFRCTLFHLIVFILGVLLLRMVLRASKNTGRYLSRNGREGSIPRMETNRLVTDGIYGCMRHPMHLGLLFFPISVALLIGSPVFILFIAPSEMILILIMIKFIEEPEAVKKFGSQYTKYAKKVPFFSFKISCLRILLTKKSDF